MSSSQALYSKVYETLRHYHPQERVNRVKMWVWVIVGLIQGQSVHLSVIATFMPSAAQAVGRIAQVRRWLANEHLDVQGLYDPIIRDVMSNWRGRNVDLLLDSTFLDHHRLQIVRLAVSHCYRAFPLTWRVLAQEGLVSISDGEGLLAYAASVVGRRQRVTLLADAGFRSCEWAKRARHYRWNYIIRLASSTCVLFPDGRQSTIAALTPKHKKQPRYLPDIRLTVDHRWPCNLALVRIADDEICALMTNLPLSRWVLTHYLKRMHIEQSFRDDKSGSFDLAASRLRDPQRLHTLLLALAIAVLWLFELGQAVLQARQRPQFDPAYRRQLSVFQLGWRFLQRALACFYPPPLTFSLRPFVPEPVWYGNC